MNKYRKDVEYYLYNRNNIKTSLDREEKAWSTIIETVYSRYEQSELGKLLSMKYDEKMAEQEIFEKLHIEKTTFYVWRNRLINEITLQAAYMQLIKPF
jgi:hypothetical protein